MRFFDKLAETATTRNRLPHWEQVAATYFITFRLADSIPREAIDRLESLRKEWLARHPLPWDMELEKEYHALFSAEIDRLMDKGHGSCVLRDPGIRGILTDSFAKFDGMRYVIHSFVVMPNHVHLLCTPSETCPLSDNVRGWKSFSARLINRELGKGEGALWQKDYFDRIIRDWRHFFRVANYIRRNPAKGKLPGSYFTLHESDLVKRMLG